MTRRRPKRDDSEGPIAAFIFEQLASACFSVPTAALIWWAINYLTLLYLDVDIGLNGFIIIVAFFLAASVYSPKFFPDLLGRVWTFLIRIFNWWW